MATWDPERISNLDTGNVRSLRENALRLGQQSVVDLCNAELERRKPAKSSKLSKADEDRSGSHVSEFHFVCPAELNVIPNTDGTKWTGTWVVAEAHAIAAEKYASIVALHVSKAEKSYLQGVVKGWRKSQRAKKYSGDQPTKIDMGIDFLIEPISSPLPWKGDGAGEKGYAWSKVPP